MLIFLRDWKGFFTTHNGYLSILIQYGIIFGGLVILILFIKKRGKFLYKRNDENLVYLFIIGTLCFLNFESLLLE